MKFNNIILKSALFILPVYSVARPVGGAQFCQLNLAKISDSSSATTEIIPADNSAKNKRNNSVINDTAEKQGTSASDIDITRRIREALVANESLSTYAHNLKIITRDGKVLIRGPVRSSEEKQQVIAEANRLQGSQTVTTDIQVVSN